MYTQYHAYNWTPCMIRVNGRLVDGCIGPCLGRVLLPVHIACGDDPLGAGVVHLVRATLEQGRARPSSLKINRVGPLLRA